MSGWKVRLFPRCRDLVGIWKPTLCLTKYPSATIGSKKMLRYTLQVNMDAENHWIAEEAVLPRDCCLHVRFAGG